MNKTALGQIKDGRDDFDDRVTLLIEPRSLTRQCLAAWLEQCEQRSQIHTVASPQGATELDDHHVVLLIWCIGALSASSDIVMSGVRQLRERFSEVPLALLADREGPADIRTAIRLGVTGYVPTSLDRDEALEVLKFVRAGGTYVPASAVIDSREEEVGAENGQSPYESGNSQAIDQARIFDGLTPREVDVVDRLRQGKPNKVIAHELDISESTVKVFVHRILNKLGAVNRTEVAYLAQQQASQAESRLKRFV